MSPEAKLTLKDALLYVDKKDPRAAEVLVCRYVHNMILSDVGREFGISKERIRQIEARALRTLKQWMVRQHIENIRFFLS